MKKQALLVLINVLMFIAFIATIVSIIIYKFIPSQLQGNEIVEAIHGIAGQIFFYLVVCHVVLNWSWIKSKFFTMKKGAQK
jgi:sorbitol-specific phosphotransferase system component IIBC